ncbi:DUF885 domain-containing protein [Roseateles sp. BYS87W]|uniref:DUF885 domain-containing protein n=1 Tax=Pelomonas baiyunensis TaxID=3299026 RepID=A0ABW7GYP5_9BURK
MPTLPHRLLHRLRLPALLLTAALSLPTAAAPATPAQRLADIATRAYDDQARFDPLSATGVGDHRFDDQLPLSHAPAERARRFAAWRGYLKELAGVPVAALSPADRLTRELLVRSLQDRLALAPFPEHLLPLEHMSAVPVQLAVWASGQGEQPLRTVAQHEAFLKRLAGLPAWCAQAQANLREGMRRGVVQSEPVVRALLPLLADLAQPDLARNPLAAAARALDTPPAGLPVADAARLAAAYRTEVAERSVPALQALHALLQGEYLAAAARRPGVGWGSLPQGAAWYRQLVRDQTTTALTPAQVHQLGLREVARIQAEITRVAPQLGFTGDPLRDGGLLAWTRTDPRFRPFKTEAEVLDAYRAIDARVTPQLPRLFGKRPTRPLDIRAEPEFTRATASDHYGLSEDDGRPAGVFWAVIPDPTAYSVVGMGALFLHEGQPGHHFHTALQLEMPLPEFRRRTWINAYGEGWALYAETLGHELGLYTDPVVYVGQLRAEISRAGRLVVDTGLHAQGWSRERAMAYWRDVTGAGAAQAANQIDRYLAWPGQALGYKVGALKIQELRRRAEQQLGAKFNLAAFHDQVLGEGSLPLAVLERRIDAWIATQRR